MNERLRNRQSSGRRRIGVLHAAAAQERWRVLCDERSFMAVRSGVGAAWLQCGGAKPCKRPCLPPACAS